MKSDQRITQLKSQVNRLPNKPGVYIMSNQEGKVIYVGKAKGLKINQIEITITITEREALILENTLIKKYNPKFNILLKDGKSYPYIEVNSEHDFPRFIFHRGKRKSKNAKYLTKFFIFYSLFIIIYNFYIKP